MRPRNVPECRNVQFVPRQFHGKTRRSGITKSKPFPSLSGWYPVHTSSFSAGKTNATSGTIPDKTHVVLLGIHLVYIREGSIGRKKKAGLSVLLRQTELAYYVLIPSLSKRVPDKYIDLPEGSQKIPEGHFVGARVTARYQGNHIIRRHLQDFSGQFYSVLDARES